MKIRTRPVPFFAGGFNVRRLIGGLIAIAVGGAAIVAVLGFLGFLKGTPLGPAWDSNVRGYGPAGTPQECADKFKKALKERDYAVAAKYTTKDYAEQMNRGADGAREMAQKLDDLMYQMKEHGFNTDETKVLFLLVDPFPTDVDITVSKETGDEAEAKFVFNGPALKGQNSYKTWQLDRRMFNVFCTGAVGNQSTVRMKKEAGAWKFDFHAGPELQTCVARLNDEYKDYVNAFKVMTTEVKNEPTTKENAENRLKTLMEEAAK